MSQTTDLRSKGKRPRIEGSSTNFFKCPSSSMITVAYRAKPSSRRGFGFSELKLTVVAHPFRFGTKGGTHHTDKKHSLANSQKKKKRFFCYSS
ncbi:hypothetical protein CDAR_88491 [Caerostris darwini]|uniref:Ribosomal protein L32 n=1 Tax=Caerostris darwini TaxID=1538125 RepID=A0AAV4Q266_9ARAC|nr:hypothetical protein CDAR_88491 [Caerostris darwini]